MSDQFSSMGIQILQAWKVCHIQNLSIRSHLQEEYACLQKGFCLGECGWCSQYHMVIVPCNSVKESTFWNEHYITSLMPLLRDQAHSIATLTHAMKKLGKVALFNPGQTPVIAANQPLYALLKQIQWEWSEYGEDKFIKMFGGLHIEMAALKSIGTLLEDSGWISAIVAGGVASSGTAESFLTASSVTRTRLAHQITACTLYKLMRGPYEDYCSENISTLSFDKNQPTPASVTVGSFTHARSHSRLRFFSTGGVGGCQTRIQKRKSLS